MPTRWITATVHGRGGGSQHPPAFTSGALGIATAGRSYSHTFTATGSPVFAVASGSLPAGVTLAGSGVLSGIPTSTGTFSFTVVATNANGSATQNVNLTVTSVPVASGLLVGASTGSGGPAQTQRVLGTRIQRFYEQNGEMPASWSQRSGSRAPAGVVTATSIKPDISTMASGSGTAYRTLVDRLIAMNDGRPDRPGEREAMWHEPYGDSFSAATWVRASRNFYHDVILPTNATRTNPILYYINLQGSTIPSGNHLAYFTPEVCADCDEITFDCYQDAAQDNGSRFAADHGKPFGIPELGYRTGQNHSDAQIRAYMELNVPRLANLTNLTWVAWFNGGTNSIVGPGYTQSCSYWKAYADAH